MAIQFSPQEILETIRMVQMENLDIRTITMGVSLRDCARSGSAQPRPRRHTRRSAARPNGSSPSANRSSASTAFPIINKRVSVTPVALVAESSASDDYVVFAERSSARQPRWA